LAGEVARNPAAFAYFRGVAVDRLVTTDFVLARSAQVDRLRGDLQQEGIVCVGDKFSGDKSRVSCKDVMATSIHSGGLLMAGPVQVLPDTAAALAVQAAEAARGITVPVGGANRPGRPAGQPPTKAGQAAREFVVAMCNALFALLHLKSLQAYAPTHTDAPTASTTRARALEFGGMWFNADRISGDAHWVLPPELWPAEIRRLREQADSEPGVVVRILVISADEGGDILKAFFFLGAPLQVARLLRA